MKVYMCVDMQNDFISGPLGTKEAQKILPKVVNKINKIPITEYIVFTKDTHFEDYLDTLEGKNLPVAHCIDGTEGREIHEDIVRAIDSRPELEHNVFSKNTFGCIKAAEHLLYLSRGKIEAIEIFGLCTDICVISNALLLKAVLPEVEIIVDASCCAGVTPESHKTALAAMKSCQIRVINEH